MRMRRTVLTTLALAIVGLALFGNNSSSSAVSNSPNATIQNPDLMSEFSAYTAAQARTLHPYADILSAYAAFNQAQETPNGASIDAMQASTWTTQVITQDFNPDLIAAFQNLPPVQHRSSLPEGMENGVWDLCRESDGCGIWTSYRSISATMAAWDFGGGCTPTEKKGCVMLLVNVGNTATSYPNAQTGPGMYFTTQYYDGTPSVLAKTVVDLASYMASITLNESTDRSAEGHPWMNTCSATCEEVSVVIYTNDPRFNLVAYTTVHR